MSKDILRQHREEDGRESSGIEILLIELKGACDFNYLTLYNTAFIEGLLKNKFSPESLFFNICRYY